MYTTQPSYWEKATFLSNIDIAIVGAGLVGTSASIYLKKKYPKAKVVLFDRAFISSGASTKNAGFACFGSISELLEDMKTNSHEEIFSLLERRYSGMMNLLELCGEENLDFQQKGGFEVFTNLDDTFAKECVDQIAYFNDQTKSITGLDPTYEVTNDNIESDKLNNINTCIVNQAEGQLNPGMMMQRLYAIASELGVLFYNGVEVRSFETSISGASLHLDNGWIVEANKLLVANNGFARKLLPELELETVRNQVLVTNKIPNLSLSGAYHMHHGYFYFRDIDSRVLIGGGRHLDKDGETTDAFGNNTLIEGALIELLESVILKDKPYKIEHKWSGILGVGPHKQPIMKQHSEHVYLAVRLGGMGVALGSLLGKEIAKII